MKTKQKLFLIAIFSVLTEFVFSQERYVQVVATDTVELKPTEFVYTISIKDKIEMNFIEKYDNSSEDKEDESGASIEDVEKILKQNKIEYKISENSYVIGDKKDFKPNIVVVLKSEAALKDLYEKLNNVEGISGMISDVKYEPISKYEDGLYKSLYSKALASANKIAGVSGNSVGQLISVEEVFEKSATNDPYSNYTNKIWDMMAKSDILGLSYYQDNMTKKVIKNLTFKFQLK